MTLREKLAAVLTDYKIPLAITRPDPLLDALCAIVEAERDAAIEECAAYVDAQYNPANVHSVADRLRSLKKAGGR